MKHFAATLLVAASLATTASAMTFSLPTLDFPDSATTVSTQSCTVSQDTASFCK